MFSDYGPEWKTMRKVSHTSLKMYGTGNMEKFEKIMLKDMEELIKRLDAKIGQSFDPKTDLGELSQDFCISESNIYFFVD